MKKNINDNQSQSTRIVMDALQRSGIPVVPVTDEFAERFIYEHERADKAQFRYIGQHILYSNALTALESIRQERATPKQWLAMLSKTGGIKSGEDRWTGLSDWLSVQTAPLLEKKQILEYLNSHSINLHEEFFTEIHKSEHFKELQQELDSLAEDVEENYNVADQEYGNFMERMQERYGDDWTYEMTTEESEEEEELQDERDRWNTDLKTAHQIAFNQMEEKYGNGFNESFSLNRESLEVYNENEARQFIANWTIDDKHLEVTTNGLDNYYELALWVENINSWDKENKIHFGDVGQGRCIGWVRFGDAIEQRELSATERQNKLDAMPGLEAWEKVPGGGLDGADLYFPPDYDPNRPFSHIMQRKGESTAQYVPYRGSATICHSLRDAVRMYNELNVSRTEKIKVLVVDEIQSHRHQEGRKKGYRLTEAEEKKLVEQYADLHRKEMQYKKTLKEKYGTTNINDLVNDDERLVLDNFSESIKDFMFRIKESNSRVEAAPFEKNWHELCMKRMLRYAAEEGYDKLAWTTGMQQNIRYDTAKYINFIQRGADDSAGRFYKVGLINHGETHFHTDEEGRITHSINGWDGNTLSDVFGVEMARKIMDMKADTVWEVKAVTGNTNGMNVFYDKILPSFMNHYGKKWGVQVKPLELSSLAVSNGFFENPFIWHSVDVTPAMKQSVIQGQPMFMKDRKGQVYGWTLDGTIYLTPRGMNAETGIHEYTHLWAEIMRQKDKQSWKHVKGLLKDTTVWKQVLQDRNYRNLCGDEDRIASEVLARISGRDNTAKLEQAVRQVTGRDRSIRGLEQIKQALGKFWSWVGRHIFNIRQARTISDVTDRILGDLLRGTKPERYRPEKNGNVTDVQLRIFGQHPNQIHRIRCKIDGEQQMYTDITRKEAEQLQREKDPQKREQLQQQIIHKYFADRLQPTETRSFKR